jgi:hypothetical protein
MVIKNGAAYYFRALRDDRVAAGFEGGDTPSSQLAGKPINCKTQRGFKRAADFTNHTNKTSPTSCIRIE